MNLENLNYKELFNRDNYDHIKKYTSVAGYTYMNDIFKRCTNPIILTSLKNMNYMASDFYLDKKIVQKLNCALNIVNDIRYSTGNDILKEIIVTLKDTYKQICLVDITNKTYNFYGKEIPINIIDYECDRSVVVIDLDTNDKYIYTTI